MKHLSQCGKGGRCVCGMLSDHCLAQVSLDRDKIDNLSGNPRRLTTTLSSIPSNAPDKIRMRATATLEIASPTRLKELLPSSLSETTKAFPLNLHLLSACPNPAETGTKTLAAYCCYSVILLAYPRWVAVSAGFAARKQHTFLPPASRGAAKFNLTT